MNLKLSLKIHQNIIIDLKINDVIFILIINITSLVDVNDN